MRAFNLVPRAAALSALLFGCGFKLDKEGAILVEDSGEASLGEDSGLHRGDTDGDSSADTGALIYTEVASFSCDVAAIPCHAGAPPVVWTVGPDGLAGGCHFDTLQAAIDAASEGDRVCVFAGVYEGITLWSGKDLEIIGVSGPEPTVLDGGRDGSVLTLRDLSEASLLSGFTVTKGYAITGGGLYLSGGAPRLTDLLVTGNDAEYDGGGMFLTDTSATVSEVTVTENEAGWSGGGIMLEYSPATLQDVTVMENSSGDTGGGIALQRSPATLLDVNVSENYASEFGGGISMELREDAPRLTNVTVSRNHVEFHSGAGMYLWMDGTSLELENVSVTGNTVDGYGGGVCLDYSSGTLANLTVSGNNGVHGGGIYVNDSSVTLQDLTVTGNTSLYDGGGGLYLHDSEVTLTNVIVSHNSGDEEGGGVLSDDTTLTVMYSDLWGNTPSDADGFTFTEGEAGNLSEDPEFASLDLEGDPTTWDLQLSELSPLIDAGDPALLDPDGSPGDIGALGPAGSGW